MTLKPPTPGEAGSAAHMLLAECLIGDLRPAKFLNKTFIITDGQHAKLSPSKAKQWIHCHGSVDMKVNAAPPRDPVKVKITRDMVASVEIACDIIQPILQKTTIFGIEEDIKIPATREGGSVDVWAYMVDDDTLYVWDYKSGRGKVDAEDNAQMRTYGTGLLPRFPRCKRVRLAIVQPTEPTVETFEILTPEELRKWESEILLEAALDIRMGDTTRHAGEHCEWCKKAGNCKEQGAKAAEVARTTWAEIIKPDAVTNNEPGIPLKDLPGILSNIGTVEQFFKAVKARILHYLMVDPKSLPTLKLVEGKTNRKWIDEDDALDALIKAGFDAEKIAPPTLLKITDIEGMIAPKKREKILAPLVMKPKGKPTIATQDDKRPAILVSATDAFEDEIEKS